MSKYSIVTKKQYNHCGKELSTYYHVKKTIKLFGFIPISYYIIHGYSETNRFERYEDALEYIESQVSTTKKIKEEEYNCQDK